MGRTPNTGLRSVAPGRDEDVPDPVDRGIAGSAAVSMEQLALNFRSRLEGAGIPGVRRRVSRLDPIIPDERGGVPIREPTGRVSTEWVAVPALSLHVSSLHTPEFT